MKLFNHEILRYTPKLYYYLLIPVILPGNISSCMQYVNHIACNTLYA